MAAGGSASTGGVSPSSGGSGNGANGTGGAATCEAGFYDSQWNPGADCTPVTHCAPGTFEERAPTTITDRLCAPCELGYTDREDLEFCLPWSRCGFDQLTTDSGTVTADTMCEPNPAIRSVNVGESTPHLVAPPGEVLLVTSYAYAPHFRRFTYPGLEPFEQFQLGGFSPYRSSALLLRGSAGRVFFVDTYLQIQSSDYVQTPVVRLIDGSPATPVWESNPSWSGSQRGATVLTDDTLVVLYSDYDDLSMAALAKWTPDGSVSTQPFDLGDGGYAVSPQLIGRDGSNTLYVLSEDPRQLVRVDSGGSVLGAIPLGEPFDWANGGAVTPSGAVYLSGSDELGSTIVGRVENTGAISFVFQWPSDYRPPFLRAVGENLLVGGSTDVAWTHPLEGYQDALVLELAPDGLELRSWQFGSADNDSVETGDVTDSGQIIVAAYSDFSVHLVELVP